MKKKRRRRKTKVQCRQENDMYEYEQRRAVTEEVFRRQVKRGVIV